MGFHKAGLFIENQTLSNFEGFVNNFTIVYVNKSRSILEQAIFSFNAQTETQILKELLFHKVDEPCF